MIFMDIQMPVMDGITAVKRMRRWETEALAAGRRSQRTPIYAVSAHAFREEVERSLAVGCDGHMNKPLSKLDLLELLEQIVERGNLS